MTTIYWKGGTGATKSDISTQINWVDSSGTAIDNTTWNSGDLSAHDVVLDISKNITESSPVPIIFDGSPATVTWNSLYIKFDEKYGEETAWNNLIQFGNTNTVLVLSGLDVRQAEVFSATAAATIKFTGIPHHSSIRRAVGSTTGTVSGGNDDGDLYIKLVAGTGGDKELNRFFHRTRDYTDALLSIAAQYTTAGMFRDSASRNFFTFVFEPPNNSVLVLDNGIYPKMTFDCASTDTATLSFDDIYTTYNEYSNTHTEVDMLHLIIDSSFTVKPTNHELRNRRKIIKLSGGYTLRCATFDMGYATLEIIPVVAGVGVGAYVPSSDTATFGPTPSATQKMGMNVKLTKLIIGSPVNEKYKILIADNNIITCEELQIRAGARLYGPSYGDDNTAEIHCLAPPLIEGDWNFTEISQGIYRASGTSPVLPPTMGGTGLNEIGLQGQVLSVKSDGKSLEWSSTAGGGADGNTTYSITIPNTTTKLRLTGNDSTTDDIEFLGSGATSVTRTNADTFTISSTIYTHPSTDGSLHVPATGTSNEHKVLTAGGTAGAFAWGYSVEKNVPSNAVFTDTQLDKTSIDGMGIDAATVDGKTVGKNVPTNAVFTDTQLDAAGINNLTGVDADTVGGFAVGKTVPQNAEFTDSVWSTNNFNKYPQFFFHGTNVAGNATILRTVGGATGYPMPVAGKVVSVSFHAYGTSLSGSDDQGWRVGVNSSTASGDKEDFGFSPNDMTATFTNNYVYNKSLSFAFDAGDIIQLSRLESSPMITYSNITAIIWVQYG